MPFLRMTDGTVIHVRMAGPKRRRCTFCDGLTPQNRLRECDFLQPDGRTCDRLMCATCAHQVGPNKDWCPTHAAQVDDLFDRTDWPPQRAP